MKKFLQKIFLFLTKLFGAFSVEKITEDFIKPSIEVITAIRKIVKSNAAYAITDIIPGTWDDELRDKFEKNLSKALDLLFNQYHITGEVDISLKIYNAMQYIKTLNSPMRSAVYAKLASILSKLNAGEDVAKEHAFDLATQAEFSRMKSSDINIDELEEPDQAAV